MPSELRHEVCEPWDDFDGGHDAHGDLQFLMRSKKRWRVGHGHGLGVESCAGVHWYIHWWWTGCQSPKHPLPASMSHLLAWGQHRQSLQPLHRDERARFLLYCRDCGVEQMKKK